MRIGGIRLMLPKFRAYDLVENEWINIRTVGLSDNGELWYLQSWDDNENDIDPPYFEKDLGKTWVLLQSTGLLDKNGNEIFESEIVDVQTLEGTIYLRGIVKKVKGGFYIEELYRSKNIPLTDFYFESYTNTLEIEILGNIYEHTLTRRGLTYE